MYSHKGIEGEEAWVCMHTQMFEPASMSKKQLKEFEILSVMNGDLEDKSIQVMIKDRGLCLILDN